MVTRTNFLSTALSASLIGLLALTGCANKRSQQSARAPAPTYAPRADSQVYYQRTYQDGDAPPADLAWGDVYVDNQVYAQPVDTYPAEMVGYETMTSGEQVVVVTYVHTYIDPIETYPRVYWAGRWYYNVNGSFVFWDAYWGSWVYYYGPPAPLVVAWNYHYPWVGYCWGNGYYGPGWYWGGTGYYGWHAYGRPPTGWRPSHGPNGDPGGPTGGRPSHGPNGGGTPPTGGDPPTGVEAGGTRPITPPVTTSNGNAVAGARDVAAPGKPPRAGDPTTTNPSVGVAGTDVTAPTKPGRAPVTAARRTDITASKPPRAGSDPSSATPARRIEPSQPPRAPVVSGPTASRANFAAPRQQPARARVPSVVQVHDASGGTTRPTYDPPTARRAPTATVTRRAPTTVGTNPNPRSPSTSTAPSRSTHASTPSSSGPTYRTVTPSHSPSSSSSSSPSRSYSPSSSSPSRSYSPSSSSPSRSYSPSHSSSPSRSSSPSSSSPSRSYSPSRSSGGGGSSFSPSRSSGGGGHSSPPRSSGGGGGHSSPPRSHR
ncbi:hypothetical protein ACNOYE_13495 [Nannocystaceae bacterium ST9]